jgi:hypothetical protein
MFATIRFNRVSSPIISKTVNIKEAYTKMLPVVLYGCEIWYLTLHEEHRLSVFENKVVR